MDNIKKYWEDNAANYGQSHWASWGDLCAIALEIETISAHIKSGDYVLDVGCANGFSTQKQYWYDRAIRMVGIDFSEKMIAEAKAANAAPMSIEYAVGDIRNIAYPDETFDMVYTTRTLINLPTWEEQMQGIKECLRVTKKGGTVVLSEGFWEPLVRLNALRLLCGLDPLVEHDFNRYLKQSRLNEFLTNQGLLYTVNEFSSVYYLGSRLLRELFTDIKKYKGYDNPVNQLFYDLSNQYRTSGYGIQIAYVIKK